MSPPLKWAVGDRCRWGATLYRIKAILPKGTKMRFGPPLTQPLAQLEPIEPERILVDLDSLELAT